MPTNPLRTMVRTAACLLVVMTTVAFGQVWEQAGFGGGGQFYVVAIDPTDSDIFYLGSDVAGLYKSYDGGDSWEPVSAGLVSAQVASFAIDPTDTDRLWLGTPLGLHLSIDGGDSWTLVEPNIRCFKHVNFGGISVSPDGQTVLVAGHGVNGDVAGDGTLYRSTNAGASFNSVASFPGTRIPAVAFDPYLGSQAFLLVRNQGVLRSIDSGATWQDYSTGLPDGRIWQQIDVGQALVYITAEPAEGVESAGVFRSAKTTAAWTSVDESLTSGEESGGLEIGDPIRIDPDDDEHVYLGQDGYPASFFQTSDGGASWTGTPVETSYTFDTVNAPHGAWMDPYQGPFDIAVDAQNPSTVLYGTWISAWLSTDGGASFSERIFGAQNVCTTAVHVIDDTLLATNMDGGISRSTDGGTTWNSAFPASMLPLEFWLHSWSIEEASGGDLYFGAGTTDGPTVYRSTDAGVSWQATGSGLPSSDNSEVDVFTEVSLAADPNSPTTIYAGVDRFGLYRSTDSGNSWQLVVDRFGANGEDEPVVKSIEVDPTNSQRIFMGEHWNGLWFSEDGGQNWSRSMTPGLESDSVQDIVALPNGRVWAAFADGVYLSTDNGHSFSRSFPVLANLGESELEYVQAIAVNPADSTDLAVSTAKRYPVWYNRGSVWRSVDDGRNWTDITGDIPSRRVRNLAYSASDLYAATWCAHVYSTPLEGAPSEFQLNQGIAGAWYDAGKPGQGFLIDIDPDSRFIFIAWFTYEASNAKVGVPEHRWLTAQGNYSGNSAQLPVFVTSGGLFDDPQAVATAEDGSLTISFSDCRNGSIHYELPGEGLQGQIPITRVISGTEGLCEMLGSSGTSKSTGSVSEALTGKTLASKVLGDLNQGITGAWFDPDTAGQGFLFDVEPASQFIFLAWFTYEDASQKVGAPEHRWLTAQGNYSNNSAQIPVFNTSGGLFDDPQGVMTEEDGSLMVTFTDCANGNIQYELPSDGLQSQIEITRVIPGTEELCELLQGESRNR